MTGFGPRNHIVIPSEIWIDIDSLLAHKICRHNFWFHTIMYRTIETLRDKVDAVNIGYDMSGTKLSNTAFTHVPVFSLYGNFDLS